MTTKKTPTKKELEITRRKANKNDNVADKTVAETVEPQLALIIDKKTLSDAWHAVSQNYPGIKPNDINIILKGMEFIAHRPLNSVTPPPGVVMGHNSMFTVFVEQLLTSVIEARSKGITFPVGDTPIF